MKAYLDFQGFTRMIDIPNPVAELNIPIMERVTLFTGNPDSPKFIFPILKFYRHGELIGGGEIILTYKWDGELPRSNDE